MRKHRHTAAALAALTLAVVAACSDDETASAPLPEGPPDLHILSLDAPGTKTGVDDAGVAGCFAVGDSSSGQCSSAVSGGACGFVVMMKTDANGQIPLLLPDGSQPRFWTFQPPLGCQGAPDCGYALLLVDPSTPPCAHHPAGAITKIAAGPVISIDSDELRRGVNGAFGEKTVRVEFWPGEGFPEDDECFFTEARVSFELTCGGGIPDGGDAGDAGPDASDAEGGPKDASRDSADASSDATRDATDAAPDVTSIPDSAPDAPDAGTPPDAGDATVRDASPESG